jgi:lysophospholipase L1-like esterase
MCHSPANAAILRSLPTLLLLSAISGHVPSLLLAQEPSQNTEISKNGEATAKPVDTTQAGPNAREQRANLRLVLPREIPAVVGQEVNIYFENIVLALNPANYAFDAVCGKGKQQVERWTWTPTAADVGVFPWEIVVRDEWGELVAKGTTQVRVTAADARKGQALEWLAIGDSLTHGSVISRHVLELSKLDGGPALQLIGSHGPEESPEIRHEGYGGWTALRFATHFTPTARTGDYKTRGSPFLFETPDGSKELSFSRYCAEINGGKSPGYVTIFLGPNDIFSADEMTIESTLDTMLRHYDQLIAMLRAVDNPPRVGVMTAAPPAATQDAFGANYASGQTRWQYRRNQHRLVERMLEKYEGRNAEGIDLIPTHLALDCRRQYPVEKVASSQRAGDVIERQNNGVHPAAGGYRQLGDAVYAWLLTK